MGISPDMGAWRLRQQRYRLVGEVCDNCGEVYSYTTVYDAPEGYEKFAPYTVALIKLAEGPMLTAMLTDVDNNKVEIGMSVEMITRKLRADGDKGIIIYGYKFRPLDLTTTTSVI